jgi:prevent-host-death family protein
MLDFCLIKEVFMVSVSIRELTHHFSKYLSEVKEGERIVVLERNVPVVDIIPHNQNVAQAGWKRPIKRVSLAGETLSETVVKNRREGGR